MSASGKAASPPAIVLVAPYGSLHIDDTSAASDHAIMRARQLSASLRNMPDGEYSAPLLSLARQLAEQLVQEIKACNPARSSSLATQLASLLLAVQNDETGPCDILWLAQQMADEIVGALCGMLGVPV